MDRVEIKKVLVALDLSDYSQITFRHAATLAEKFDAELVVLNVINSEGLEHLEQVAQLGYPDLDTNHYLSNLTEDRRKIFRQTYKPALSGIRHRFEFKMGTPYRQIIKAAKEEAADLLVIGAKGSSSISDMLFGVNAEKIIRRSPCTVVSVRE